MADSGGDGSAGVETVARTSSSISEAALCRPPHTNSSSPLISPSEAAAERDAHSRAATGGDNGKMLNLALIQLPEEMRQAHVGVCVRPPVEVY